MCQLFGPGGGANWQTLCGPAVGQRGDPGGGLVGDVWIQIGNCEHQNLCEIYVNVRCPEILTEIVRDILGFSLVRCFGCEGSILPK